MDHTYLRDMRSKAATALALVMASALAAGQEARVSDSLERPFVTNGRVSMDLSAGEYRIVGASDNRIRLEWSVRDSSELRNVRARAEVRGSEARISTDGPTNHFKVAIQVPARADLYIRLTAGELKVENVQGNKDIESHAGELNIDVGRADDYNHVEASIWAGEIHAPPYSISKEGLFRSFDWKGRGPYRLHARLKAGELRLFSKLPAERER
jgi:hypothetical protein